MKGKKRILTTFVATVMALILLAGCGGNTTPPAAPEPPPTPPAATTPPPTQTAPPQVTAPIAAVPRVDPMRHINALRERVPIATTNTDPIIEDGQTLRVATLSTSSFTGLLDPLYTTNTLDSGAAGFLRSPSFLSANPNRTFGDDGIARIAEWNHDTKSVLIVMQEEVYWHDGVRMTLDDLVFAYEVLSNPDYTGIRWGQSVWNVLGTREYRAGEADHISGLELSEDKMSLRIYFDSWNPGLQYFGFWTSIAPRHHLEHIPVAELAEHANVRHNTLGWGPFTVAEYVPGESYLFQRFDNFMLGKPKVENIVYDIIPATGAGLEMRAGNYDIAMGFPQSMFGDFQDEDNFYFVGAVGEQTVGGWSFVLGHYDSNEDKVVVDPNRVTADPVLRQAIAMAIDYLSIGELLFNGLVVPSTNIMGLLHLDFHDPDLDFYRYNPEEAMRMLDEAGYRVGPDGWRTRPNGEPLALTLLNQNTTTIASETNLELYLQSVRDIGINLELFEGRTVDFQVLGEIANSDGPWEFDIIAHAWSVGYNPDPNNLWGPYSRLNRPRYSSDTFYEILRDRIYGDERMWDDDFARQAYYDWQRAFYDETPFFPQTWSVSPHAVNNRVSGYSLEFSLDGRMPGSGSWYLVGVTETERQGQ